MGTQRGQEPQPFAPPLPSGPAGSAVRARSCPASPPRRPQLTFEKDETTILALVGRADVAGQAAPEVANGHGVVVQDPVVPDSPEPAALGRRGVGGQLCLAQGGPTWPPFPRSGRACGRSLRPWGARQSQDSPGLRPGLDSGRLGLPCDPQQAPHPGSDGPSGLLSEGGTRGQGAGQEAWADGWECSRWATGLGARECRTRP